MGFFALFAGGDSNSMSLISLPLDGLRRTGGVAMCDEDAAAVVWLVPLCKVCNTLSNEDSASTTVLVFFPEVSFEGIGGPKLG